MSNEIITNKNERIKRFFGSLDTLLEKIETALKVCKPTLNGERYLNDREVAKILKVSRRTLQDYRNQGMVSYIHLGGKILYRESDIQKMLDENYRKAGQ